MEWRTTSSLLDGLREYRRDDAWSGFVERFRRPIIAFARRMGHTADDAEDIAQETLVTFAKAYGEGRYQRERGRLSHWLFGIAWRQAMKQHERATVRREVRLESWAHDGAARAGQNLAGAPANALADERQATSLWDREWERSLLEECLACVQQEVEPETYRAFEMTALQNQSASDAAAAIGIAVTAVYNAKHRVVKRLRELRDVFENEA